ncbi:hypothetical protein V6N11_061697 [Hibiscus sabdariffa]|uniref:Uncharacterized protein n=1 Tax=Hibiscus sabdariffa TaxID=183260 RepID=A0ABR2NV39_9ROSI
MVTCGIRSIRLRTKSGAKAKGWVAAINDAGPGLRPPEGWCHPHRFGSFAPPRGLTEDGSQAQWFVELYLRRPFHEQASSRLDALLEAKAKQGVQAEVGSVCFQSSLSTHDYTFIKTYQASTKSNSNAMITNANSTFLQIMTGGKLLLLVKRRN